MDIIGGVTIYSVAERVTTTVDFSISYYSTAKIQVSVFLFLNPSFMVFFWGFIKFKAVG